MSAASYPATPSMPEMSHCPTCGGGAIQWGKWAEAVKKKGLLIKVTRPTGEVHYFHKQQARFTIVINEAGGHGLKKAQLPGMHVGFYAQRLRDLGFACTTQMVKTAWPWSGKYGLYRMEERLHIEDWTGKALPKKTKSSTAATVTTSDPLSQNKKIGGLDDA